MPEGKWLTQEAHDTLSEELQRRSTTLRKELSDKIGRAADEGDLKENAGYHAAREEQGVNEARIKELEALLRTAQIGTPDADPDEVAHGKVVTVKFTTMGLEKEFLLASREEGAHASIEVFSTESPLGSAIVGKRIGESASYDLPNGKTVQVEILSVKPYGG